DRWLAVRTGLAVRAVAHPRIGLRLNETCACRAPMYLEHDRSLSLANHPIADYSQIRNRPLNANAALRNMIAGGVGISRSGAEIPATLLSRERATPSVQKVTQERLTVRRGIPACRPHQ